MRETEIDRADVRDLLRVVADTVESERSQFAAPEVILPVAGAVAVVSAFATRLIAGPVFGLDDIAGVILPLAAVLAGAFWLRAIEAIKLRGRVARRCEPISAGLAALRARIDANGPAEAYDKSVLSPGDWLHRAADKRSRRIED